MKGPEAVEILDDVKAIAPGRVAARAYELYVARGREDGHDASDWLQAEAELRAEAGEEASLQAPADTSADGALRPRLARPRRIESTGALRRA